jgi:hypothetical protein
MPSVNTRLARQIKRMESDESVWVPRAPTPTLHLGWLDEVDPYRNVAVLRTNDPSLQTLPTVPWVQAYTATNLPTAGDLVQALRFGTSVRILGRLVVPDSTVLLG